MKPTSEILERIERCPSEHKGGIFTRLYRYLLREDIYYAAYQKLYANKGATTQGIDDDAVNILIVFCPAVFRVFGTNIAPKIHHSRL